MVILVWIFVGEGNKHFEVSDWLLFQFVVFIVLNAHTDWAVLISSIHLK